MNTIRRKIYKDMVSALVLICFLQGFSLSGQYRGVDLPPCPNPYNGFDQVKIDFSDVNNGCMSGTVFYSPGIGNSYHFYITNDGGQTWEQKGGEMSDEYYYQYLAASISPGLYYDGYGWSFTDNLFRVSDSGDTWFNYYTFPNYTETPQQVFKYNDQYQFLLAQNYLCDTFSCQILYRLEGENKSEIFRTRKDTLIINNVDFLTPDNRFLITFNPVDSSYSVRRTANGGIDFQECLNTDSLVINYIDFFNDTIGIICFSGGHLYKTTDGGISWNPATSGISQDINVLSFIDNMVGYFGGAGHSFYRTADQGETWIQLPMPPQSNIIKLNMLEDGLGYIHCNYEVFFYLYADTMNLANDEIIVPYILYPNPSSEKINILFNQE